MCVRLKMRRKVGSPCNGSKVHLDDDDAWCLGWEGMLWLEKRNVKRWCAAKGCLVILGSAVVEMGIWHGIICMNLTFWGYFRKIRLVSRIPFSTFHDLTARIEYRTRIRNLIHTYLTSMTRLLFSEPVQTTSGFTKQRCAPSLRNTYNMTKEKTNLPNIR